MHKDRVSPTLGSFRATHLESLDDRLTRPFSTLRFALAEKEASPPTEFIIPDREREGAPGVKYILTNLVLQVSPQRARFERICQVLLGSMELDQKKEEEGVCYNHRLLSRTPATNQPASVW